MFDTHCHALPSFYGAQTQAVLNEALAAGCTLVNIGTQYATSQEAVATIDSARGVYATVGLHPSHAHDATAHHEAEDNTPERDFDVAAYEALAVHDGVVAIGECGLDYYRLPEDVNLQAEVKAKQLAVFLQQIALAVKLQKSLVVHCRPSDNSDDAYEDLVGILEKHWFPHVTRKCVVHSFTGSSAVAKRLVGLGCYLGINGIITFDKTPRSREVITTIPLTQIVLETDAPFLTPIPYRGEQNKPVYVQHVAEKIAEWLGLSVVEVITQTDTNARILFNLM
jgi:TatD DNase family protein